MKILGTGLQGLVGSRIVELLSSSYEFENISRSSGVDITHVGQVTQAIKNSDADIVLHLAAKADVDGCEKDKSLGYEGEAWKINVEGTQNVANACEESKKKLIYISTDFVFDGEKDFYTEEDNTNPLNWYAQTKYEGEKIIQQVQTPWIIARIAYPYRAVFSKNDFIRAVKARLQQNQPVSMVVDHIMTPTFIDDITFALDTLIKKEAIGTFHLVGSEHITPFDAAITIADTFGFDKTLIGKTTREAFFQGRAPRPFRLALKNDKITKLGVEMATLISGLEKIKTQL
jgi:dTDP-4-dehydrorhamnose reductase